MPINETYRDDPRAAILGMIADTSPATIISRTVKGSSIGFGLPAKEGDSDHTAENVTTGDTSILGISVRVQGTHAETVNGYGVDENGSFLVEGAIWVTSGVAVSNGDPVFVTVADGTFHNASGAGRVQIQGASYETSAAADALVKVRIK